MIAANPKDYDLRLAQAQFYEQGKEFPQAIAAYLKSLKPVQNQVPGPFGPSEKPTVFVMTIIPGLGMPPPPAPAPAPGQQK